MSLQIERADTGGASVVAVAGEVDLYSSPELRKAIKEALAEADSVLAIDLKRVSYMDSSGVATLIEGLRSGRKQERPFVLLSPSDAVLKVLQLSRLDSLFDIRDAI